MNKLISPILILLFCLACSIQERQKAEKPATLFKKPTILFLFCKAEKAEKSIKLELTHTKFVEGRIKKKKHGIAIDDDAFAYVFLDKRQNILSESFLPNPLSREHEGLLADGRLGRIKSDLPKVDFSIREQLPPEAFYIKIYPLATPENHLLIDLAKCLSNQNEEMK